MNLYRTFNGLKNMGVLLGIGVLTACASNQIDNQQVAASAELVNKVDTSSLAEPVQTNEDFVTIAARLRAEQLQNEQSQENSVVTDSGSLDNSLDNSLEQQRVADEIAKFEQAAETTVQSRESASNQQNIQPTLSDKELTEIARLQGQIEVNDAHTDRLNAENSILLAAINVAAELTTALSEEEQKYSQADVETGFTPSDIHQKRIEELTLKLDKLRSQTNHINNSQD